MRNNHITAADWQEALDFLGDVASAQTMSELEGFVPARLRRLFRADLLVWERYDRNLVPGAFHIDPLLPGDAGALHEVFKLHFPEHPAYPRFDHGFRHGIVYVMSDFASTRRFLNTGLWCEVYIHLRAKHQLGFAGPYDGTHMHGVSANRLTSDFGARDRELARFIRPRLEQMMGVICRRERAVDIARALAEMFQSACACALITPDGRIVEASPAAGTLLAQQGFDATAGGHLPASWLELRGVLRRHAQDPASRRLFGTAAISTEIASVVIWPTRSGPALVIFQTVGGTKPRLTHRERDVLLLLGAGLSNARIAEHLGISPRTVAKHCSNLFAKLGVESRFAAALLNPVR